MPGITIITPTGGRPECFALCEFMMNRQDYAGPVQWLLIDDCVPQTIMTMGQDLINPLPVWQPGQNTQARNLLLAIPKVKHDIVLLMEDDDYFRLDYLSLMSRRFHSARTFLVGEGNSHYYHPVNRQYKIFHNPRHSSLCATGIRADHLHMLTAVCEQFPHGGILDIPLWRRAGNNPGAVIHPYSGACIGIKGLPGRPGITGAHREQVRGWFADPDCTMLRSWIGDDANLYTKYYNEQQAQGVI